jgi:hypothetical protein
VSKQHKAPENLEHNAIWLSRLKAYSWCMVGSRSAFGVPRARDAPERARTYPRRCRNLSVSALVIVPASAASLWDPGATCQRHH